MIAVAMALATVALAAEHPALSISLNPDQIDGLRKAAEPVLSMTEEQMLALIPEQSGLYFVGCINCAGGQQEGQLKQWSVEEPDVVRCAYCGHAYPSETYPTTGVLEVRTPNGGIARYPYHESRPPWWQGEEPYRSFFAARVDYHKIRYMENMASTLARLFTLTGEADYGRRAALILHRFAQVFPGYCYHFDFPFRQKVIYEGDVAPEDFRPGYRTARWTWWAYSDISQKLLEAYDLLAGTDMLERLSAERNTDVAADLRAMLTMMAEQVIANPDSLGNMSPGMWADLIRAGRVLDNPDYVHTAIGRLQRLVVEQFFYDGSWLEGAPSYHLQVLGGLNQVFTVARGYSDPPGYTHPETGERFDDLDLAQDLPEVVRARAALARMCLPDGRFVPVHDTWWTNGQAAPTESRPDLLGGLGHAILGLGEGERQLQAHLTWSPGCGHQHNDGLSLLLHAHGHELLSDIGYTHTKWREWAVLSPSHNLVVVDQANQVANASTYGDLRYFAPGDPVQVVSVDNPQVYPEVTERYRRTVALVRLGEAEGYLVDVFEVAGGEVHDYFLHGSADVSQTLEVSLPTAPRGTLVPEGVEFVAGTNEQHITTTAGHAYGYLTDLQAASVADRQVLRLEYRNTDDNVGLVAYTVGMPGDELVIGQAPSIRQAGSDDSRLDDYHRRFAMLRRAGGSSLFVSVIAPFADDPVVEDVRLVELPGAALALEVTAGERTDLVLIGAAGLDARWRDAPLQADGELAVLATDGQTVAGAVVAGRLAWGGLALDGGAAVEHELLAVERAATGGNLLVAGEFLPPAGTVVTVDHAGRRISPYTVVAGTREGDGSHLQLADDPGFEYNAQAQESRFIFMPRESYQGAHVVRLIPVAQGRAQR